MGPVQTDVADGDFLQRLQAVGGEARRDDVDIAQLLPAPFEQNGVRVRLKPWRTSETALVADRPRFPFQPQSVGKQARRALALEKIGAMPNLPGNWWSSEEIAEELGEPKADRLTQDQATDRRHSAAALLDPLSQVGASGQRLRPPSQPTRGKRKIGIYGSTNVSPISRRAMPSGVSRSAAWKRSIGSRKPSELRRKV